MYTLLKATAEANGVLFGLLSASTEESTIWAAHLAGFDLFLIKPVDPEKFGRLSERILNKAKSEAGTTAPSR